MPSLRLLSDATHYPHALYSSNHTAALTLAPHAAGTATSPASASSASSPFPSPSPYPSTAATTTTAAAAAAAAAAVGSSTEDVRPREHAGERACKGSEREYRACEIHARSDARVGDSD